MEALSVFDKLVEELSRDERRKMLSQIESQAVVSAEPLRAEQTAESPPDTEISFQALSSFVRFLYRLKGLFSGKTGLEAFEESLLNRLKKEIARDSPKLADFRHSLFLDRMKTELEGLKVSAEYLQRIIFPPFEKNRSEFIAFLARCQCEGLMRRLEDETDPRTIVAEKEVASESEIKAEMDRRFHEILAELPEDDRQTLYLDCQSLEHLKLFCVTDFESLLGRFTSDKLRGGFVCSFGEVAKRLLTLADILKSARLPPSKNALKALFLYALGRDRKQDPEWADFLEREFSAAEQALVRIRAFNHAIPLDSLARILSNDYNYRVTELKGGEDWFVLFKKYWAARLSAIFRNYVHTLRTTTVIEKAYALLGIRRFEEIKNYHPASYDPKLTVAHWRSLSFILAFFKSLFVPKFSKSLKILFLNGEFYKTENRIEYADAFNYLATLNEKLLLFEKRLEPGGEIGKAMDEARREKPAPPLLVRKLEPLLKKADAEALALTEKTIAALKSLNRILNGILFSEAGGRYDTLSNLGYIGGKENELLKKDWEKIITLSYEASLVLSELVTVEAPGS